MGSFFFFFFPIYLHSTFPSFSGVKLWSLLLTSFMWVVIRLPMEVGSPASRLGDEFPILIIHADILVMVGLSKNVNK